MEKTIIDQWLSDWHWMLHIAEKRNWEVDPLVVKPPVDIKSIEQIEDELNVKYPVDFKEVLTQFSSAVLFSWQIEEEEAEDEFSEIFCGGGRGYLWDIDTLKNDMEVYTSWVNECFSDKDSAYDRIWHDKVPFLYVPNGDMIVFDTSVQLENCPVIYLSHDDSKLHGYRLAENFIEFITLWSNLGCVGTEDWQFEPFYDEDLKKLKANDPVIDRWKEWLES